MAGLDTLGNPVCEPLDSLDDVINWDGSNLSSIEQAVCLNNKTAQCQKASCEIRKRPQVLVCHDMKGGYLDDRFSQGNDNPLAYRFYHWNLIDTFVYFSHRFVTIPPLGWIRAAHRNGVQILGTVITEWDRGAKICQELLASKETIDVVAAKLADIAFVLGFDGWLINIENVIEKKSIRDLQYFVQQVTHQCHSRLEDAKVLWYDSVTHAGSLDWQNELNDKNELFFSQCDGIFLNYAITEDKLANSKKMAQTVNRCFDVYVGVDVFGRATPGGGGFNCKQVLELISRHGLSCALFAQGWVYEKHGAELFDANEMKFWKLIKDFLPQRIHAIPFETSFCQGSGQKHYLDGKVISDSPWHNLSLQQLQPCYSDASLTTFDAYNGGGCLKITSAKEGAFMKKLFKFSVDKNEPLVLSAVWKHSSPVDISCGLAFVLLPDGDESETLLEKAMILTHDNYDDEIWNRFFLNKKSCPTSLQFVTSVLLKGEESNGWKTSQWDIDTGLLLNNQVGHHHVNLCAVVLSDKASVDYANDDRNVPASSAEMSVLLGRLQVQQKCLSLDSQSTQPNISKVTCLEVNTQEPVTKQNVSKVILELGDWRKKASQDLHAVTSNNSLPSAHSDLPSTTVVSSSSGLPCLFKSCQLNSTVCKVTRPMSLHILNWTASNDDDNTVDYYVVFSIDEKGLEKFIGCTCTNSFVHRSDRSKPSSTTGYLIQPVTNNNGSQISQKVSFSIL